MRSNLQQWHKPHQKNKNKVKALQKAGKGGCMVYLACSTAGAGFTNALMLSDLFREAASSRCAHLQGIRAESLITMQSCLHLQDDV